MSESRRKPQVLIIFYSFSGQTRGLLQRLADGIRQQGVAVRVEKLRPASPLLFPVGTVSATVKMMVYTFFRWPVAIKELSPACYEAADLIVLAGPTWSYNPSGPVLALAKRDGPRLCAGKQVIPFISCRGYWRTHWYGLKRILRKCGAAAPNLIVFTHPCSEPWRTIGVFLKIAGKKPEQSIIGKYYPKYGHSKEQQEEARRFGIEIGRALREKRPLAELDFKTSIAMP